MYLLDTNTCIHFLNGSNAGIATQMRALSPSSIALCSIVKAELLYGARHSARVEDNLRLLNGFFTPLSSLPFDDRCAEEYAIIRAQLAAQGSIIGPNDLLIAATARACDATLVTHNIGEFSRISGLRLTNWEQ